MFCCAMIHIRFILLFKNESYVSKFIVKHNIQIFGNNGGSFCAALKSNCLFVTLFISEILKLKSILLSILIF